ncbi:MAG: hypothetical protein M3153_06780 [Chloroflexota bacterium]|nr:hypothetical protein [Chloroflexota bacterium]
MPIVVAVNSEDRQGIALTAASTPSLVAATVDIASAQDHAVVRFERSADAARAHDTAGPPPTSRRSALRLALMRILIERIASSLPLRFVSGA